MFDTLKIYIHKEIPLDQIEKELVRLNYKRVDEVLEEGDFSLRGDTLEVFPVNFSSPLRIEWEFDRVDKIYSFDKALHKRIIDYDWSNYDYRHVVFRPARMTPEELQNGADWFIQEFYSVSAITERILKGMFTLGVLPALKYALPINAAYNKRIKQWGIKGESPGEYVSIGSGVLSPEFGV